MIGLIISVAVMAFCLLVMAIKHTLLEDKLKELENKFYKLADTHNSFVDFVADEFDDLYVEWNERIDEINDEFHKAYTAVAYTSDTLNDIVNVLELMCDTDEAVLNRLNDSEDELCMINAEIDDIITELFNSKPEENKEKKTKKSSKKASHK